MLPCTETSDVPGLNRGLQLAVPSHRHELQTAISDSAGLTSALANLAASRIVLASGTYNLIAELSITRSVILEAAAGATVILNAQASFTSRRRVVNINPGWSGVVQLVRLNITGASDSVRVLMFKSSHRPDGLGWVTGPPEQPHRWEQEERDQGRRALRNRDRVRVAMLSERRFLSVSDSEKLQSSPRKIQFHYDESTTPPRSSVKSSRLILLVEG